MGSRGPAPKRSTQRRRANKVDVDRARSDGQVRGPALTGRHSAVGRRFYEGLRRSGQAQFFEPSDWAAAELVVVAIDAFIKSPSAGMLGAIRTGMAALLATEGDRRRIALELERVDSSEAERDVVSELGQYRDRLAR